MSLPGWQDVAIAKQHDRKGFDCGQPDLNSFLSQHARKAHENGVSKTYVALDAENGSTIHGFYTLSPAQVDFHRVPIAARPAGGRYPVGGFRLGRLAVSKALHGQGLGGQLLIAAAKRCIRASAEMGGTALMIDAKDERAAAWYQLYGAVPLHDAPLSLLLPYDLLTAALEAAGRPLRWD
jgi:GNAT superfamily N-acetyltransferase